MAKTQSPVEKTTNQTTLFITMAMDMTWRLAIVVLVPVIGGYELDKAWKLTPLLTITGFVLAMAGMGLVMWTTLQKANSVSGRKTETKT